MSIESLVPAQIARLPWSLLFIIIAIGGFGGMSLYSAAGGSFLPWALPHAVRFSTLLMTSPRLARHPSTRYD